MFETVYIFSCFLHTCNLIFIWNLAGKFDCFGGEVGFLCFFFFFLFLITLNAKWKIWCCLFGLYFCLFVCMDWVFFIVFRRFVFVIDYPVCVSHTLLNHCNPCNNLKCISVLFVFMCSDSVEIPIVDWQHQVRNPCTLALGNKPKRIQSSFCG